MPLADWLTHPPTHSLASIPMMWDQRRNPSLLLLLLCRQYSSINLWCHQHTLSIRETRFVVAQTLKYADDVIRIPPLPRPRPDHHPPRDIFFGPKLLLYYSFVLRVSVRHHRQAADYTRHNTPQPQKQQRQHCCWWCSSGGPCGFVPSRFSICIANFFFWARTTVKLLKLDFPPIDY